MADINFGILDTQSPAKIGNAFIRSPEQQNANMLQVMQMKHLIDQSDQAQYAINKARREDTGMAEFGNAIKALGPDPSLLAIAQVFMKHPNPEYQLKGLELGKQARADQGYRDLGPMGAPAARPAVAPAPGSFGENMLANRAALPSFGDKQSDVTAGSFAPAAPMTEEGRIAEIQPRLALLRPFIKDNPQAKAEYDLLADELKELRKPETIAPGSIRRKAGYATFTAPAAPSATTRMQAELDAMLSNDPARPALQAQVNSALVLQQQGKDRLAQGAANLAIRNREIDPYGMFPQITAGGARPVNALPGQPRPTVNALPAQVSGVAPAAPVAAPAGIAPKMTVAEAFQNNVTGPEFVAVLPPNVKPLVESILRYDQRPPNPATRRGQQLLELVNQADKTYDAGKAQSRYVAKQTFVKGPVADSITASNTAIDHMDTLAKYGADLNNTDVRLVNAAKQGIAAAFGANAPTTFDATRRIVGQEVVKAVVANGGSMREREEAADAFNRANSPAQLAGVIQSYQALLGGRLKSTALRYENDTGLKDFNTKLLPATIRAISGETVAPAATASAGAPVKITGDADYDKLPSGTVFIDPKGQQRRKP